MNRIRALTWYRATTAAEREGLEKAFHVIGLALRGTPGLIVTELLRSAAEPDAYVVLSEWESGAVFHDFERAGGHDATAALRPYLYRDRPGRHWELLEVGSSYRE